MPTVEQEDRRQLHRELARLKREWTQQINRIKGLQVNQEVRLAVKAGFLGRLEGVRLWDGSPLLPGLRARVSREHARLELINQQIKEVEAERRELLHSASDPQTEVVRQLLRLGGIGINSAWLYVKKFFRWRQFRSRREADALAGPAPMPYPSEDGNREQGIDKAGNCHILAIAIEIAWG